MRAYIQNVACRYTFDIKYFIVKGTCVFLMYAFNIQQDFIEKVKVTHSLLIWVYKLRKFVVVYF